MDTRTHGTAGGISGSTEEVDNPEALDLKLFNDSNLLNPIPKEFLSLQIQDSNNSISGIKNEIGGLAETESSITLVELEECFSLLNVSSIPRGRNTILQATFKNNKIEDTTKKQAPFADSKIPVFSRGWDKLKGYMFSGFKTTAKNPIILRKPYSQTLPRTRNQILILPQGNPGVFSPSYARVPVPEVPQVTESPSDSEPQLKRSNSFPHNISNVPRFESSRQQTYPTQKRVYVRPAQRKPYIPSTSPSNAAPRPSPHPPGYTLFPPHNPTNNKNSCPPPLQPFTRSKKYIKTMVPPRDNGRASYIRI